MIGGAGSRRSVLSGGNVGLGIVGGLQGETSMPLVEGIVPDLFDLSNDGNLRYSLIDGRRGCAIVRGLVDTVSGEVEHPWIRGICGDRRGENPGELPVSGAADQCMAVYEELVTTRGQASGIRR